MNFSKIFFRLFLVLMTPLLVNFSQAKSAIVPQKLVCEYLGNPLGLNTVLPRLGWSLTALERNQSQSAYEIIVSDDFKEIQQMKGKNWTSGKVISAENTQIDYQGEALKPFTRYYWRVKVYDQQGEASAWSDINWFETAMFTGTDWKAKWISDGSQIHQKDEDYYKIDRMPLFRKEFKTNKKIVSARLYIAGVGYYEAFLNGKKISENKLDPGWTTYRKEVLYVVHDITNLVIKGNNVTGIMLGNGWWNPASFKFFGRWDLRTFQQTGRPCVKAEIHIHYADGSMEKVLTDENWQTAAGPIIRNNVYMGETYDARLEQPNWSTGNPVKEQWKNSISVEEPSGELSVQMQPPIKITKIIKPISIKEIKKDTFIVDFGQNFAGVAKIRVKGVTGTKIILRYGEGLFKDSSLNVMTTVATQIKKGGIRGGAGTPETAWQEDSYILKGEGVEEWSPQFTFHGFQYLEITGWPGKPTLDAIEGLRMNTDLKLTGTFECSNGMFNQLHEVIQWTFLSNVFSVQSDCPGREKMGYGADMVVSSEAFLYNYDMANFYRKAITDFANEQRPQGGITEIAPFTGIDDRGYGDLSGPLGWQLGFPYLHKKLYEFYGDKRIIANNYEALKKQMSFLQSQAQRNLFYWDISDHESLDPKPESFSASAFYYHHAILAAEFAGILGKKSDSLTYSSLAKKIKKAIIENYLVPTTGRFDKATQGAQTFALWYNLSPEKEKSMDVLMSEFARHNWHVAAGIFGTKMMFDVLRENDQNEVAYKIANQRDYPGWGNMLQNGATTLWETWQFPETGPSRNHPMFGSIDEWFYRSLLGINAAAPGFQKIIIKPQPVGDLTYAKGSFQSIHGKIVSGWKKEKQSFLLNVEIPVNTTAEVFIPASANDKIYESGVLNDGVVFEGNYAKIIIGSGVYSFEVKK